MRNDCEFHICPVCFTTSEEPGVHHGHEMVHCRRLPVGHDRLKPIFDESGRLKTRAPRWFLQAVWEAAGIAYPPETE
jgi:hypothetical protein